MQVAFGGRPAADPWLRAGRQVERRLYDASLRLRHRNARRHSHIVLVCRPLLHAACVLSLLLALPLLLFCMQLTCTLVSARTGHMTDIERGTVIRTPVR